MKSPAKPEPEARAAAVTGTGTNPEDAEMQDDDVRASEQELMDSIAAGLHEGGSPVVRPFEEPSANDSVPSGAIEPATNEGPGGPSGKKRASKPVAKPRARSRQGIEPNNVRKLRQEAMMSKAELARRAGVSPLTIDRVEAGCPCRMDTKRKILEALGLKPSARTEVWPDIDDQG
jgi:DNA-binding XRE family transcriptional regulator